MNLKRKDKFDKASKMGIIFSAIAFLGICYELIFSDPTRPLLIIMYGIVIGIGGLYIFFIKEPD